jgi:hypothetical protein
MNAKYSDSAKVAKYTAAILLLKQAGGHRFCAHRMYKFTLHTTKRVGYMTQDDHPVRPCISSVSPKGLPEGQKEISSSE